MSDWPSDVCPSDLAVSVDRSVDRQMDLIVLRRLKAQTQPAARQHIRLEDLANVGAYTAHSGESDHAPALGELPALLHLQGEHVLVPVTPGFIAAQRSEEHTSELQSLMRISYAVFSLKKK